MLKTKKSLSVLFFAIALLFSLSGAKTASAQNGIFISTLSIIPGHKIVKDFGSEYTPNYSHFHYIISSISDNAPAGANACINLKFVSEGTWPKSSQFSSTIVYTPSEVGVCEYVRLVPKK